MKQKLPIIIAILLVISALQFWRLSLSSPNQGSVVLAKPTSESKPLTAKSDEGGTNVQPGDEKKKGRLSKLKKVSPHQSHFLAE
jgi:hypothetical protein